MAEREDVAAKLIEIGLPTFIAREVAREVPDARSAVRCATRYGLKFVILMVVIIALLAGECWLAGQILFPDAMKKCSPDIPMNVGIAIFAQIFAAIAFAGWGMTLAMNNASRPTKLRLLAGSLLQTEAGPYARAFARKVAQKYPNIASAEEFFQIWNTAPMLFYRWPALFLIAVSLATFFLVPADCV